VLVLALGIRLRARRQRVLGSPYGRGQGPSQPRLTFLTGVVSIFFRKRLGHGEEVRTRGGRRGDLDARCRGARGCSGEEGFDV
jgi:hypothetical protein